MRQVVRPGTGEESVGFFDNDKLPSPLILFSGFWETCRLSMIRHPFKRGFPEKYEVIFLKKIQDKIRKIFKFFSTVKKNDKPGNYNFSNRDLSRKF
jgi:hypothetical protein